MNPEPSGLFFDRVSPGALSSLPCTYLKLLQDRALPPAGQDRMAARIGARIVGLDCGHTAMLARPLELASIPNEIARSLAEGRA